MSAIIQQRNEARENQAEMLMTMERKLNFDGFAWFRYNNKKDRTVAKLSVAQYWDLLTFLDDDYLTDYEILKMKELYRWQLHELSGQFLAHGLAGWCLAYLLMGPIVKSSVHGYFLRVPPTMVFASFVGVQAQSWERPSKTFNDLVAQPAPHGSYLRKTIKYHFPVWWNTVSADLHLAGHNLPEMNEYDRSTVVQNNHLAFDKTIM